MLCEWSVSGLLVGHAPRKKFRCHSVVPLDFAFCRSQKDSVTLRSARQRAYGKWVPTQGPRSVVLCPPGQVLLNRVDVRPRIFSAPLQLFGHLLHGESIRTGQLGELAPGDGHGHRRAGPTTQ